MAQIHILSKETIDQIAAGEVVERPVSVVKELVENAIDAKATAITVEIKDGGISMIRVTDNGCGIEKSQVQKAFLRHATSKINSAEDLFKIASLGFRGEALSSISAVSQLELITKTKEDLTGIRFLMEGGRETKCEEIGAPGGTTVLVRNLFFNTPVRKKFLKQPQTEGGYISELMEHISLSNPQVSFKYIQNGQVKFHTSGNESLKEIVYRIYGRDISNALLEIKEETDGIKLYGLIGKPEINRSNRNFEHFFVNGRYIKSRLIGKAVEQGYQKYLMQHKFPFVVLHLEVLAEDLDVNVHPTKMEVRFSNQERLYEFLTRKIAGRLGSTELIPEVVLTTEKPGMDKAVPNTEAKKQIPEPFENHRRERPAVPAINIEVQSITKPAEWTTKCKAEEQKGRMEELIFSTTFDDEAEPEEKVLREETVPYAKIETNSETNCETLCNTPGETILEVTAEGVQETLFEEKRLLTPDARPEYQMLGQIFSTYWLITYQEKLFIIDQHAAHEKVKYENFMRELTRKSVESQMLLPPIVVTLSAVEQNILKEFQECFEELGFEIESFGGNEYTVRSVPAELYGLSEKDMFCQMMDEISEDPGKGGFEFVRNKIAVTACKAAVKGNRSMSREEMEALLDQLLTLEDPYHCPHGRPTIIAMTKYEIEKKFKRIV